MKHFFNSFIVPFLVFICFICTGHAAQKRKNCEEKSLEKKTKFMRPLAPSCVRITMQDLLRHRYLSQLAQNKKSNKELFIPFICQKGTQLTYLDINSFGTLTNEDLEAIAKSCPNIESLNISGCNNIKLLDLKEPWSKLETLTISLNHLNLNQADKNNKIFFKVFLEFFADIFPQLQRLNILYCDELTDELLKDIVINLPHLKHLFISRCYQITDQWLATLRGAFSDLELTANKYMRED